MSAAKPLSLESMPIRRADAASGPESQAAPALSPWESRAQAVPATWYTTKPPRRTWLFRDTRTDRGVYPHGRAGMFVCEGGGGKTTALVQWAIAVATGGVCFGHLQVVTPGDVLLVLGEEDAEEVARKAYNACRATNAETPPEGSIVALPLAGVPSEMVVRDPNGNPTDGPFLLWLRDYLARPRVRPWRLIVLDPLSRFAGLDAEKDNALATRFIAAGESLSVQTGASVLISHHTAQAARSGGKVATTAARGVTALTDGVRWVATMGVDENAGCDAWPDLAETVTFRVTKSNYAKKPAPILLRRDSDHGGALVPLDDTEMEILARARASVAPTAIKAAARKASAEERERDKAAALDQRKADAAAKLAERHAEEDAALRATLEKSPGMNEASVITEMRVRLGACSDRTARECIVRAQHAGWLDVRPGPKNAKLHFLRGA